MKISFPKDWQEYLAEDAFDRVVRQVDVEPDRFYQEIGIRSHGKGLFEKPPVQGKSLGDKRVFWVEPNCLILNIIFAWEQAVARTTAREKGMIASHRFPMFRPKDNIIDLDFALYFFKSKWGKKLLEIGSPGGAGRNKTLSQKEFDELPLCLPPFSEQRRIAAVLGTWDEAINQTERLIAAKRRQFHGVSEILLGGGRQSSGTSVALPHIQLGKLIKLTSGQHVISELVNNAGLGTPYLTGPSDFSIPHPIARAWVREPPVVCSVGDILITVKGSGVGSLSVADRSYCISRQLMSVTPKGIEAGFLRHLCEREISARAKTAHGMIPQLTRDDICNVIVTVPPKSEQIRIAGILDTFLQQINWFEKYLFFLQIQRNTLMQRLLTGNPRFEGGFE